MSCGIPEAPGNGSFSGNEFALHSKVTYECDEGFQLDAGHPATALCQEDGSWSNRGRPPPCKRECRTQPPPVPTHPSHAAGELLTRAVRSAIVTPRGEAFHCTDPPLGGQTQGCLETVGFDTKALASGKLGGWVTFPSVPGRRRPLNTGPPRDAPAAALKSPAGRA